MADTASAMCYASPIHWRPAGRHSPSAPRECDSACRRPMINVRVHGRPEVPPFRWQAPQTAEEITGIVADELQVQSGYLKDEQQYYSGSTLLLAGNYIFKAKAAQTGRQEEGELNLRPLGSIPGSALLRAWESATTRSAQLLHTWSFDSRQFAEFLQEKGTHLWRLSKGMHLQVRTCTMEPDVADRADGTPGSYTLQAELMKRVYELVDIVDTKTINQLRRRKIVPTLPLVRTSINTAVGGDTIWCVPDVRLGVVWDAEADFQDKYIVAYQELKIKKNPATHIQFNARLRAGQAQCITASGITFQAANVQTRIVPCVVGDGVRIQGISISHSRLEVDAKIHSCSDTVPLSGQAGADLGDNLRNVDTDCEAFKEVVYLMWLARRLYLDIRGAGAQEDVAFRPGDVVKVATESGIVGMMVVEALTIARARGGVYKVVCRTGPCAGQQFVLKHGGRPEEMAQLRERRVNIVHWHQVLRERELHLHLGSSHSGAIPQMHAHGQLTTPLPPGASALEGAVAVLLTPFGEELEALPLPPKEVLNVAADLLGAILELLEGGAFHNDINPRHVLLQPPQQWGRHRYMLIDYGGAACPRLADPAIEAQICPPAQDTAPMLDMRPSVLDPLCGSLQSLWGPHGRLLSQGSDLQSLVYTLVLLAGGHLPWETAAYAGDIEQARVLRMQLIGPSGDAGCRSCLQCLPEPVHDFATWVLDTAHAQTVDVELVRGWHRVLLAALDSTTLRQQVPAEVADNTTKASVREFQVVEAY